MVEIAGIIVIGIFAQWLAWKIKVPAIFPLIIFGLLVGPIATLWTEDGGKLIEPIWNGSKGLFAGEYLFYFVELSIGLILFEGGLTLKRNEVLDVGPTILKLISVGSAVTFIGGGIIAHFLLDLSWSISFLFSGLIIVTGPTVIAPILRNVPLKKNMTAILKWEGILIDPIGALVAVLVFDFINTFEGSGGHFTQHALLQFVRIILLATSLGFFAAYFLRVLLKRNWIPHYLLNVVTLALVMAVYVGSGIVVHESGLLTVVVMGMVLGNLDVPNIKEILYFKESISILLISILFILLSANINMDDLALLNDWRAIALFLSVILFLRPLGVFLSSNNSGLSLKEKIFISWVGPRGIVAAGIASLFGLKLTKIGMAGAEFITPLVFMIVLGTVLLNATTARFVAKWLGVTLIKSNGILIIGANKAALLLANYLVNNGRHVVMVDNNRANIEKAVKNGIDAFQSDIYADELLDNIELNDMGYLLALTGSFEVNTFACNKFRNDFGENGTYRLISADEMWNPDIAPTSELLSIYDDYINLSEAVRDYPAIHEIEVESQSHFIDVIGKLNKQSESIPLFLKQLDGNLEIIPGNFQSLQVEAGESIVYVGKVLNFDTKEEG